MGGCVGCEWVDDEYLITAIHSSCLLQIEMKERSGLALILILDWQRK